MRRALAASRWPIVLAALAALAACAPQRREKLVLGTVHLPALGLVYVAQAKGYFARHGVEIEARRFTSGRDALAALAAGEVDAATALGTAVVLRAGRDPSLRVVTTLHVSSGSTRLVARSDRGIAAAPDLAGKRIGVPRDTSAEYFLDVLLAWDGIPDGAVSLVDVAPEAAPDALAAGEVDAVAIWTPHAERARRMAGHGGAVELGSEVYTEISVLATREPVIAARRGALVKLVAALADAERLARERPWEAYAVVRAEFEEANEADLRDAWRRVHPTLGVTHQLAAVLEDESRWFRAGGRIDAFVDVGTLLAPDILSEVDAEAVTFVPPPAAGHPR